MFKPQHLIIIIIATSAAALTSLSSCSTGQNKTGSRNSSDETIAADSSVDIRYALGHSAHRFFAEAGPKQVRASSFLDKQLLKEVSIDRSKYGDLVKKVLSFMETSEMNETAERQPAQAPRCRTPYRVTVRVGKDTREATGCRSQEDHSSLGRIAREAEFLLYSQK